MTGLERLSSCQESSLNPNIQTAKKLFIYRAEHLANLLKGHEVPEKLGGEMSEGPTES